MRSADPSTEQTLLSDGSLRSVEVLIIGSGAAGLNAAVQLHRLGVHNILVLTEGLERGTSYNSGSDKQTYYKMDLSGCREDSPYRMAEDLFRGGSMHGDIAMVEAAMSARAFFNLVELGVDFPHDALGRYAGYRTDHDESCRATSTGPRTSRRMCLALAREAASKGIEICSGRICLSLLTQGEREERRCVGAVALNSAWDPHDPRALEAYAADYVILAAGGPGGLYRASVYPPDQHGAIGLALLAGARAANLQESQFGPASTDFRWNVSGSYMQVIPRLLSTGSDGVSQPREFFSEAVGQAARAHDLLFLKGYQWPFDARRAREGSSFMDVCVHRERLNGRRVFLDFSRNAEGFRLDDLSHEASGYLRRSGALQGTPWERLMKMNPAALELYSRNGIDLRNRLLEIDICAQHNNGGVAVDAWWEATDLKHLFAVGEIAGTHGVYRPGGAALNSGQVGALRAAQKIAWRRKGGAAAVVPSDGLYEEGLAEERARLDGAFNSGRPWPEERAEMQERMSRCAAHIRRQDLLDEAVLQARSQWSRVSTQGCLAVSTTEAGEALRNRQLCFAHLVYLEAIALAVRSGVGSRGSAVVEMSDGSMMPENESFRARVLETVCGSGGEIRSEWADRRPLPDREMWFESAWEDYREGRIYQEDADG